jgi:LysR family transcriptional regulator, chromosome initiation inhibitor
MLDYALVDALAAVIRHGSFERAAKELKVTQSAISQRIKLLEEKMETVLIERGHPCRATAVGAVLFQHAEMVQLMENECIAQVRRASKHCESVDVSYRIAVPDDRIASWFVNAISEICVDERFLVELVTDDQHQAARRTRDRSVHAIVTTEPLAAKGWTSVSLGEVRYRAVCSSAFFNRHFTDGVNKLSLRNAPQVSCLREDKVQDHFVRRFARTRIDSPFHLLPDALCFLQGCTSGMGWGMCPEFMVSRLLKNGELVELNPSASIDSELYWHTWSLPMKQLERIGALLKDRMTVP